jgi:septation ring formation regulator EzrA
VKAEIQSIKVDYSRLKDQTQGLALKLSSWKKALEALYNQVVPLREELLQARDFQVNLQTKFVTTRAGLAASKEEN